MPLKSTALLEKIKTSKWMIEQSAFTSLIDSVALLQANPALKLSVADDSEFKVNGGTPADANNTALICVSGKLVKGASPDEEEMFGLCNIDCITEAIDQANGDASVSDICLFFNSPGGESTGIEELGRKIASNPKPIRGWTEQRATSAAYWLLSQCSPVGMTPSACVGSIGVYSVVDDMTGMMDQMGIKKDAIFSGKFKLMGANFRKLTDEERALMQKDVDALHLKFKEAITSKRKVEAGHMEGLSYEGRDALAAGLVDMVADGLNQFLITTDNAMLKTARISKETAATLTPPAGVVADPVKKAEDAKPKEEEVPGVPGTKEEDGSSPYGEHYVECPACKHTWKLAKNHMKKMVEEEPEEEPEKKEASAVAPVMYVMTVVNGQSVMVPITTQASSVPAAAATVPAAKVEAAAKAEDATPVASKPDAKPALDPVAWQKAVGTYIAPRTNAFVEASRQYQKSLIGATITKS